MPSFFNLFTNIFGGLVSPGKRKREPVAGNNVPTDAEQQQRPMKKQCTVDLTQDSFENQHFPIINSPAPPRVSTAKTSPLQDIKPFDWKPFEPQSVRSMAGLVSVSRQDRRRTTKPFTVAIRQLQGNNEMIFSKQRTTHEDQEGLDRLKAAIQVEKKLEEERFQQGQPVHLNILTNRVYEQKIFSDRQKEIIDKYLQGYKPSISVQRLPVGDSFDGIAKTEADRKIKVYNDISAKSHALKAKVIKTLDDPTAKATEERIRREIEALALTDQLRKQQPIVVPSSVLPAPPLKKGLLPRLSDEDYAEYEKLINSAENDEVIAHPESNIFLKGRDLKTLGPQQWLNDEIINVCIKMLQQRDTRLRNNEDCLKCHFFSSFFLNKLYKDKGRYEYAEVKGWTRAKRLQNAGQASESILDCDRIIVPVNQSNLHWTCAVVDLKNQKFLSYDSLGGEDHACLKNLATYIKDEFRDKKKVERDDVFEWPREFPKDIPRQKNGYDCGVFTIFFANYLSQNAPLDFDQKDMYDFRVRIVRDIRRFAMD